MGYATAASGYAATAFGGVTIIVPSNWQVHSEVSAVFGAVEDQRGIMDSAQVDENKEIMRATQQKLWRDER